MRIDLHGYTEAEAIPILNSALWEFEEQNHHQLEIVTGNGDVLKGMVIDYLQKEGFKYSQPTNNTGVILVYE